jgi:hypothetical protein
MKDQEDIAEMSLDAMPLVLYGSGFAGDGNTISQSNRILAICAFLRRRRQEQVQTIAELIMVASILMMLSVPENGQLDEAVVE